MPAIDSPTAGGTYRDIGDLVVELPAGRSRELCATYCLTCHSLQYIEMQPHFPEGTWRKLVDKMVGTFGAPIPDSAITPIVDYLVAIRGR